MPRPSPSLILLALAGCGLAADPVPAPKPVPVVPAAETVPAPPPRDDARTADLKARLPQVAWIVERDGRMWWQGADPSTAVAITAIDDHDLPVVETVCGPVAVQRRLLANERRDALAALLQLAPAAQQAGAKGLRLAEGPLTGLHLRSDELVVLPDGVLTKAEPSTADRAPEVAAIKRMVGDLQEALPKLGIDGPGRRALGDVLAKLSSSEDGGEIDDASPAFVRRVVRSGWLRQFFPTVDVDDRIEQAVRTAERPLAVRAWKGPGGELAEVRDAFGHGGWMLRTPSRSAWLTDHATPIYFGGMPPMVSVVEIAPGKDPLLAPADALLGARLWRQVDGDFEPLASWKPGSAVVCPDAAWDRAVPRRNRAPNVAGWLPPHILVTTLQGDVLALATTTGSVIPPRDATPAEGERFLAEAARALPDAAHLDLIGQHLLRYVYDSPDPRWPTLIGTKKDKGDIHQTALQTLATAAGGMIRGDCDDAAELYQTIAERQGRTAHVISLPSHAACAWAEKRADAWHVFLLQTGPALEFIDADPAKGLQNALAKTYKHFDDSDAFDPNGLGLLLRFSNENTRGSWRLSYRIFEDPEYARIMIDVQRDWHFSTYQRGIVIMQKMVSSETAEAKETANYRELSGLYSFTGQYAKAAEAHQKAIELTQGDALSSLYMNVELVGHLFAAGQNQRAREVAIDLLDHQIPAQRQALGQSLMQVGAQLAGVLTEHNARDLALRALRPALLMLNDRITESLGRKAARTAKPAADSNPVAGLQLLGDWLEGPEFDENLWDNHPALQQFRRLSALLAGSATAALEGSTPADRIGDADLQLAVRFAQVWLDRVAFRDVDEPGEALIRYATAGGVYATLLGEQQFGALVDAAAKPASLESAPARRVGGIAQVAMDAGWVRISPAYWTMKLMKLFDRDREDFDPVLASKLAKRAVEAEAAIDGTPLEHPRLAHQAHLARVIGALIDRDEKTLRACLRTVAERNDKDLRDDTAQWIGDCARRLPLDWFATVMTCWHQEVGPTKAEPFRGKQKYFWIAWRAALGKAPQHALLAAKLASDAFGGEDPSFGEEYQFMRSLLDPPKKP